MIAGQWARLMEVMLGQHFTTLHAVPYTRKAAVVSVTGNQAPRDVAWHVPDDGGVVGLSTAAHVQRAQVRIQQQPQPSHSTQARRHTSHTHTHHTHDTHRTTPHDTRLSPTWYRLVAAGGRCSHLASVSMLRRLRKLSMRSLSSTGTCADGSVVMLSPTNSMHRSNRAGG